MTLTLKAFFLFTAIFLSSQSYAESNAQQVLDYLAEPSNQEKYTPETLAFLKGVLARTNSNEQISLHSVLRAISQGLEDDVKQNNYLKTILNDRDHQALMEILRSVLKTGNNDYRLLLGSNSFLKVCETMAGTEKVTPKILFEALIADGSKPVKTIIEAFNKNRSDGDKLTAEKIRTGRRAEVTPASGTHPPRLNLSKFASTTPTVDKATIGAYLEDLSEELARKIEKGEFKSMLDLPSTNPLFIRRKADVLDLAFKLSLPGRKNSLALLGELGIGKRSLLLEFLHAVNTRKFPELEMFTGVRFLRLKTSSLEGLGEQEVVAELQKIRDLVRDAKGNIFLHVEKFDSLHAKKVDAKGGAIIPRIYHLLRDPVVPLILNLDSNLADPVTSDKELDFKVSRHFLKGLEMEQTFELLKTKIPVLKAKYKVRYNDQLLLKALRYADTYASDQKNPAAAETLIENTFHRLRMRSSNNDEIVVNIQDLEDTIKSFYGVKILTDGVEMKQKIEDLPNALEPIILGQRFGLEKLKTAMKAKRPNNENQPMVCVLLVGPTRVGKTEIAKALANYFYQNPKGAELIRMETFVEAAFWNTFLTGGAAPSYAGYGEPYIGLPQIVQANPQTIMVFDEGEKAPKSVRQSLLGVLDEGTVRHAGSGATITLRETMVIMTTNYVTDVRNVTTQEEYDALVENVKKQLTIQHNPETDPFSPEFLSRVEVIPLMELNARDYEKAIDKEMEHLEKEINKDRLKKVKLGALPPLLRRALVEMAMKEGAGPLNYYRLRTPFITYVKSQVLEYVNANFSHPIDGLNEEIAGEIKFVGVENPPAATKTEVATAPATSLKFSCEKIINALMN